MMVEPNRTKTIKTSAPVNLFFRFQRFQALRAHSQALRAHSQALRATFNGVAATPPDKICTKQHSTGALGAPS
jgi:hypothetical protein